MTDYIRPPADDAELPGFYQELCRIVNKKRPVVPADSTAGDVATLKTDFNALLAALRTAFE
uniref:Putative head fiber protein n=1 Tax=viral metagenome TaxID=1070528 RepID=A0A6H1ZM97_9ZZZZ